MLIDSHVHMYSGVDRNAFLHAAFNNLTQAGRRAGLSDKQCVLIMTETPLETGIDDLISGCKLPSDWTVTLLPDDPLVVQLNGSASQTLLLLAGRQITTAERIEVLAIGYREKELDGEPIDHVLGALRAAKRPVILPWGAGKWIGPRGAKIVALVENGLPQGVFLGDNGGRPIGFPQPTAFAKAAVVLPGSDPLPVSGCWHDVGRYGFHLPATFDPARPAQSIISALWDLDIQPKVIGRRVGFFSFLIRQIRLRLS